MVLSIANWTVTTGGRDCTGPPLQQGCTQLAAAGVGGGPNIDRSPRRLPTTVQTLGTNNRRKTRALLLPHQRDAREQWQQTGGIAGQATGSCCTPAFL